MKPSLKFNYYLYNNQYFQIMEDLKNFTKRVFNKTKGSPVVVTNTAGPQTPPSISTKKAVPEMIISSSEEKKAKKVIDFADSDDEDYEEEDDDHLRDDIGASFSAAGGSTQNTSRSSNSGGSNEGVGGVVRGLFALRRKKKARGEDQSMISQIVSKF